MFRNKVEITLPFSASNKLLTILHYGAPLVLALLTTIVAPPSSQGQLKCLIYTFLHGEFEGFFPTEKKRSPPESFIIIQVGEEKELIIQSATGTRPGAPTGA